MQNYKLLGFKRKAKLTASFLIKSTGHTFSIPLNEAVNSELMDYLSPFEQREIYRKYYSSHNVNTAYEFKDKSQKHWNAYIFLCCFLVSLYLASTITAIKPILFFNLTLPAAIFIYPLTYIISDILNEYYGLSLARKAINLSFFCNLIFCGCLYYSSFPEAIPSWGLIDSYSSLVFSVISVLLASSLAYIISEHINAYILYKIRKLTSSKYLFVRVFTSSICAAIIDSFIFISIVFHSLGKETVISMIAGQLLIKSIYATLGIFPIYFSRYLFKKFILEGKNE
ncbi:queuosine precursor transporter [Arsenophonus nasoniae]|uniref:queuosine precursor transporter n=1 Tax=Arsenophonus nasoniae TaxID=638 RepID=UPI00387A3446